MNILSDIKKTLLALISQRVGANLEISVEWHDRPGMGDIATNAAFVLGKAQGISASAAAQDLVEQIKSHHLVESAEVAKSGFINVTVKPSALLAEVENALREQVNYGRSNVGANEMVNLEFVSANPTGPLHVGHARGAIIGSALHAIMIHCGFQVTREFYINDAGGQLQALVRSIHASYLTILGINPQNKIEYLGEYVTTLAQELHDAHGSNLVQDSDQLIADFALDRMMSSVKQTLKRLGVEYDVFFSEKSLHTSGQIDAVVRSLIASGDVYRGKLPCPKDQDAQQDWEEREQLLLNTTKHGDSLDRALQKENGEWTYFASDIAYLKNKLDRGYTRLLIILGYDHIGYVARLKAAFSCLTQDPTSELEVALCQLVKLIKDGKPVKMSKRAGTFVTVDDVLDLVDAQVLRFAMLTRKEDVQMEIDVSKIQEQSYDNPVFYVQYACARTNSVLKSAPHPLKDTADLTLLTNAKELALIKHIAMFPSQIEAAALKRAPHFVTSYLQTLASKFHALWNCGRDDKSLRFVDPDMPDITSARLLLVRATKNVLELGLSLLGVKAVEKM